MKARFLKWKVQLLMGVSVNRIRWHQISEIIKRLQASDKASNRLRLIVINSWISVWTLINWISSTYSTGVEIQGPNKFRVPLQKIFPKSSCIHRISTTDYKIANSRCNTQIFDRNKIRANSLILGDREERKRNICPKVQHASLNLVKKMGKTQMVGLSEYSRVRYHHLHRN